MSVMSASVRPHRWQPTRLRHPWDSLGKNTRVGCHFLLQCMKVKSESEVTQSCPTLGDTVDCSRPGSSVHGISQARVLEWVPSPSPCSIYSSVYMSISISQCMPFPFPLVTTSFVFYTDNSTSVLKYIHFYHFFIFHLKVLIYLSFSDWLHSVWQSLGPSMSLQMALFHTFFFNGWIIVRYGASQVAQVVKESYQCRRCGFVPWVGKTPWSRKWHPTAVFLPGKFCGQRSLSGYSPWGCKELDTTECTHRKVHCTYVPHLYPFLCQWTYKLLPCHGYCK